jgi:hypothetical protein
MDWRWIVTDTQIFLTSVFLFLAKVFCPRNSKHHIISARDFIADDLIADEVAEMRKKYSEEDSDIHL